MVISRQHADHGWPARSFGVAALISYSVDTSIVDEVATFVESATPLHADINDERSRRGRSVVDTFVRSMEMVNFIVILARTPDTPGISPELFRFARILGRHRTAILVTDPGKPPTEASEVEVLLLDERGVWKERLVRLFSIAGIPTYFDLKKGAPGMSVGHGEGPPARS